MFPMLNDTNAQTNATADSNAIPFPTANSVAAAQNGQTDLSNIIHLPMGEELAALVNAGTDSDSISSLTAANQAAAQNGQTDSSNLIMLPMFDNPTAIQGNQTDSSNLIMLPMLNDSKPQANAAVGDNSISFPGANSPAAQNSQTDVSETASQTNPSRNATDVPTELTAQKAAGETTLQKDATAGVILSPVTSNATITENGQFAPSELDSFLTAHDTTAKADQRAEQDTIVLSEAKETPDIFHSDPQIVEIENEQNYRAVERRETTAFNDGRHPEINAQRITTYETPVYVSENATIKPKTLHYINLYTEAAMNQYHIPIEQKPTIVILSEGEMSSAFGRYDSVNNVIYYSQWVESQQFTETQASVEFHELWHMNQAEEFRQKGWVITEENYGQYMEALCQSCKERLDRAGITAYNVHEISQYAYTSYLRGRFDEVEAEWRSREALNLLGQANQNSTAKE